jgi:hypothetical protein
VLSALKRNAITFPSTLLRFIYITFDRTHLTIESVQVMYDIPYGDYFRVEGKWDIDVGSTPNSCRVKVKSGVYLTCTEFGAYSLAIS